MNQVRTIRSFIKRHRKLSPNKQDLFDELWKIYGFDTNTKKNFNYANPVVLEIGFGNGEIIFENAKKYPDKTFIGIEVYKPGIAALFAQLKNHQLNNIVVYNEDATMVLQQYIPNHSLEKILIFFPDPWPKKRHHKRRLIQTKFIEILHEKLKPKGVFHLATDSESYANHVISVLKNNTGFSLLENKKFSIDRIETKFERRGKKLGHKIFDLIFICK